MRNCRVYYIKLGAGYQPDIAKNCITNNLLWLGYNEVPEDVIQQALQSETQHNCKNWKEVWNPVRKVYDDKNETTQTNYAKAIRQFYTATEEDYFFTFLNSTMYYCHPTGSIIPITENNAWNCFAIGSRIRATKGWKDHPETNDSIKFLERSLSGRITKAKIFRGTIYELTGIEKETFFNTLEWHFPECEKLEKAKKQIPNLVIPVIQMLNDHDFEILVDMLLTKSGWLRIGELGGTVKAIDMEYLIPVENKQVFVQVKSVISDRVCKEALKLLSDELADKPNIICYLAFHTVEPATSIPTEYKNLNVKILDVTTLANLCCNHQEIIDWLLLRTTGRN